MAYPTPPVTAGQLLQFVADVLKRPVTTLDVTDAGELGRYQRQAAFYPKQAYVEVLGLLGTRGYTPDQFDTSDQGAGDAAGWVIGLAAWYVLRDEANIADAVKLQWQAEYDRRAFIAGAQLTSGGVPIAPANPLLKTKYGAFDQAKDRWTRCSRI